MDNIYKGEWNAITQKMSPLELIVLVIVLTGILFLGSQIGRGFGNPLDYMLTSTSSRWIALIVLLIITGTVGSSMGAKELGNYPESPYKIISFELAKTEETAGKIIEAWGGAGKSLAKKEIITDFGFIVCYVALLGLICFWVADAQKGRWVSPVWLALGWSMLIAGLLDVIENIALLRMLDAGASGLLAGLAFWAALPKSIITTVFPLVVAVMMLAGVFLKAIRPQP